MLQPSNDAVFMMSRTIGIGAEVVGVLPPPPALAAVVVAVVVFVAVVLVIG